MSSIRVLGSATGTGIITVTAPATNTDRTVTTPDASGNMVLDSAAQTLTNKTLGSGLVMAASALTPGTVMSPASGTAVLFSGIPSWARRITLMLSGVSTSGTSNYLVQLGTASGFETTGYVSGSQSTTTGSGYSTSTAGFVLRFASGSVVASGAARFNNLNGNIWVGDGNFIDSASTNGSVTLAGGKTLADVLTQIRLTTVNGTDTFDAGSVNILYE